MNTGTTTRSNFNNQRDILGLRPDRRYSEGFAAGVESETGRLAIASKDVFV